MRGVRRRTNDGKDGEAGDGQSCSIACFNTGCHVATPMPRHSVIEPHSRRADLFAGSKLEAAVRY